MRDTVSHLVSAFALILAACTKGDTAPKSAGAKTEVKVPGMSQGGTATTIHLVVQGGAHAGTYDVESSDLTCTYGFAGPGSWGNQYSVTGKNPDEFSSLQLIVPDTKDAADGTDNFLLTAGFGELMKSGYSEHTIKATADGEKEGNGRVIVQDRGQTGKVTFQGKTKDNVTLEGTIDCHQLMRGGE